MPNLPNNCCECGDQKLVLPNFQDLVVDEVDVQDIFCKTIEANNFDIGQIIIDINNDLTTDEDRLQNLSRDFTENELNDTIKSNMINITNLTLTESSNFVVDGDFSAGGSVSGLTFTNPIVSLDSGKVGINQPSPTFNLDLGTSNTINTTENFRVAGSVIGPLWNRLSTTGPQTLTNATSVIRSFLPGYYPKKITVVLRNITKTNTLANGPMVTVCLESNSGPFTGGHNVQTRTVQWNGSNTYTIALWDYSASIPMDSPWYTRAQTIRASTLTLYNMGNNVWTYNGTFSTIEAAKYGTGSIGGVIACPSAAEKISVRLARPALNGGSNTVFTTDSTATMSGGVQIIFE